MKLPQTIIDKIDANVAALELSMPQKARTKQIMEEGASIAIESLSVPQWIPVSTLPEANQDVLVYAADCQPQILSAYRSETEPGEPPLFVALDGVEVYNASHWMIPNPPALT